VSLIEMESSYVFSATTMRMLIAQRGSGNAGNTRRCFLFVFPSSEVIDERLEPTSVGPETLAAIIELNLSLLEISVTRNKR